MNVSLSKRKIQRGILQWRPPQRTWVKSSKGKSMEEATKEPPLKKPQTREAWQETKVLETLPLQELSEEALASATPAVGLSLKRPRTEARPKSPPQAAAAYTMVRATKPTMGAARSEVAKAAGGSTENQSELTEDVPPPQASPMSVLHQGLN